MKKKFLRFTGIVLFTAGITMGVSVSVNADIQRQVNSMFNSMINVTSPGAYQTASLGVVTGGSITLRNRITTISPINITPPSAQAGCGGINMYMGSFSFINADEFVGMLRNIASNAAGLVSAFAFEMAIEAMDSQTGGVLSRLRDLMHNMNSAMLNSCQIATGIVTNAKDAITEGRDIKAAAQGVLESVSSDFFGSKRATGGESPASRLVNSGKDSGEDCTGQGNILWCAMKKTDFSNQFLYGSQQNAELLMSMVGSQIITLSTDDSGGETYTVTPLPALTESITLELFVDGTSPDDPPVEFYRCTDSTCMNPSRQTLTNIDGLAKKIIESVETSHLFQRIKDGHNIPPGEQNAFGWLFRTQVGVHVRQLIDLRGVEVAHAYLRKHSGAIALTSALTLINDQLNIVRSGVRSLSTADAQLSLEDIDRVQKAIHQQAHTLFSTRYNLSEPNEDFLRERELAPVNDTGRLLRGANLTNSN